VSAADRASTAGVGPSHAVPMPSSATRQARYTWSATSWAGRGRSSCRSQAPVWTTSRSAGCGHGPRVGCPTPATGGRYRRNRAGDRPGAGRSTPGGCRASDQTARSRSGRSGPTSPGCRSCSNPARAPHTPAAGGAATAGGSGGSSRRRRGWASFSVTDRARRRRSTPGRSKPAHRIPRPRRQPCQTSRRSTRARAGAGPPATTAAPPSSSHAPTRRKASTAPETCSPLGELLVRRRTRGWAPSARNCTVTASSGSTPPRESYVDNNTRMPQLRFVVGTLTTPAGPPTRPAGRGDGTRCRGPAGHSWLA